MPTLNKSVVPTPYYDLLAQDKGAELVSAITPEKINISFGINGWSVVTPLGCAIYGQHIDCIKKLLETPGIDLEKVSAAYTALGFALFYYRETHSFKAIILLLLKKKPSLVAASVTTSLNALPVSDPIRQLIEALKSYDTAPEENRDAITEVIANLYKSLGDIEQEKYWLDKNQSLMTLIKNGQSEKATEVFNTLTPAAQKAQSVAMIQKLKETSTSFKGHKDKVLVANAMDNTRLFNLNHLHQENARSYVEDPNEKHILKGLRLLFGFNNTTINIRNAIPHFQKVIHPKQVNQAERFIYLSLSYLFLETNDLNQQADLFIDLDKIQSNIENTLKDQDFCTSYLMSRQLECLIEHTANIDQKMSFFLTLLKVLRHTQTQHGLDLATQLTEKFKDHPSIAKVYYLMGEIYYHRQLSSSLSKQFYKKAYDLGNHKGLARLAHLLEDTDISSSIQFYIERLYDHQRDADIKGIELMITYLEDIKREKYLTPSERARIEKVSVEFPGYLAIYSNAENIKLKEKETLSELKQLQDALAQQDTVLAESQLAILKQSNSPAIKQGASDLLSYMENKKKTNEQTAMITTNKSLQATHKTHFDTRVNHYVLADKDYLPAVASLMKYYVDERWSIQKGSIRRKIYLCTKVLLLCTNLTMTQQHFPNMSLSDLENYIRMATDYLTKKSNADTSQYPEFARYCLRLVKDQKDQQQMVLNPDALLLKSEFATDVQHGLAETLGSRYSAIYFTPSHIRTCIEAKQSETVKVQLPLQSLTDPATIITKAKTKTEKELAALKNVKIDIARFKPTAMASGAIPTIQTASPNVDVCPEPSAPLLEPVLHHVSASAIPAIQTAASPNADVYPDPSAPLLEPVQHYVSASAIPASAPSYVPPTYIDETDDFMSQHAYLNLDFEPTPAMPIAETINDALLDFFQGALPTTERITTPPGGIDITPPTESAASMPSSMTVEPQPMPKPVPPVQLAAASSSSSAFFKPIKVTKVKNKPEAATKQKTLVFS